MHVDYIISTDDILEYLSMLIYFKILIISFLNMYSHYVELNSIQYDIQLL
jgi:hypothetical protein